MFASITKSSTAALFVGGVLLFATPDARAEMSAEEKYQQAMDQCDNAMRGQRSFCMEEAHQQYKIDSAREQKKDDVLHLDYDTSNDTPAQTQAKQAYQQAINNCENVSRGQRSFCMEEAHSKYRKGMGW